MNLRYKINRARQAGFSLVELLVVIAIVALMATAGGPAINALVSSGGANENLNQLSGILEQARQYAVAQNTYVWVAFYPQTVNGIKQVSVAVIASTDGTDPAVNNGASWQNYSYGNVPSSSSPLALVNKIVTLKQISIQNAGTYTSTTTPSVALPTNPSVSSSNGLAPTNNSPNTFFQIQLPGPANTSPVAFTQAIQFTPSGQAQNSSSPIGVIDLDLLPQKGNVDNLKSVAVLRINGLTGQTVLYRE